MKETYKQQKLRNLKEHIDVAKQSKKMNWPRLLKWSIKQAERIIKDIENEET